MVLDFLKLAEIQTFALIIPPLLLWYGISCFLFKHSNLKSFIKIIYACFAFPVITLVFAVSVFFVTALLTETAVAMNGVIKLAMYDSLKNGIIVLSAIAISWVICRIFYQLLTLIDNRWV